MLKFEISGQKLTRVDKFAPATDSKGYLRASFTFSSDWASATKTAIFRDEVTGASYTAPLNSSGVCTVPAEVLTRSAAVHYQTQGNHFHVSLRGDVGGTLITTNEVRVDLARSGYTEGQTPAATTPDAYSQFVANVAEEASAATAAAEAAAASEQNVANLYANALKKTASGEIVTVSDVSPAAHELGLQVHGKNILDTTRIQTDAGTTNIYISEVGPGYVVISEKAAYSGNGYTKTNLTLRDLCPAMRAGRTYALQGMSGATTMGIYLEQRQVMWHFGAAMTITDVMLDSLVVLYGYSTAHGQAVGSNKIYNLQIEEGTAATDYVPYIDPTTVALTRRGKNMLNFDNVAGDVSGTYRGWLVNPKGQDVVMSVATNDPNAAITGVYLGLNKTGIDAQPDGYTWIVEDGEVKSSYISEKFQYVSVFPNTDYAVNQLKKRFNIQVEPGTVPTAYEPSAWETHAPTADGTVEGVKSLSPNLTLLTDTPGVTIEAIYHRDLVKVIEALEAALNT
jgi:hypothetical protein